MLRVKNWSNVISSSKALRMVWSCDVLPTLYDHASPAYRLVVICSEANQDQSHTINILQAYRRQYSIMHSAQNIDEYLKAKFSEHSDDQGAWLADRDR
jgi:hypothetical protein